MAHQDRYKASARLTIDQLKRHIAEECEGVTALLTMTEIDA